MVKREEQPKRQPQRRRRSEAQQKVDTLEEALAGLMKAGVAESVITSTTNELETAKATLEAEEKPLGARLDRAKAALARAEQRRLVAAAAAAKAQRRVEEAEEASSAGSASSSDSAAESDEDVAE